MNNMKFKKTLRGLTNAHIHITRIILNMDHKHVAL